MNSPPPALALGLERLRNNDPVGARSVIEAALPLHRDSVPMNELAGLLAARAGDLAAAIERLERVLALDAGNRAARINLAGLLLRKGDLEGAAKLAGEGDDPKLKRTLALACQQLGRLDEAAAAYEAVVAAQPADFESWNNLGNVRAQRDDLAGAVQAFDRAVQLRPDVIAMYKNYSEALAKAEMVTARRALMRAAARRAPQDPDVQVELGLAETAARDFPAAEQAFRAALRLTTGFTPAFLEYGLLLENLNRVDDLGALVEEADLRGLDQLEIAFLRAWSLRRQGRLDEALHLAEATPPSVHPVRRAQLLAELYDRTSDADRAYAAFEDMNRAAIANRPAPPGQQTYRERVEVAAALTTPEQVAGWSRVEIERQPPAPVFIVGFPRSGTTLLDTLLMNLPMLHVTEELPVLHAVRAELGGPEDIASLTSAQANRLRSRYFEELARLSKPEAGRIVVDKHPLHMAEMPLIHRIFPDARVVLVERHPCDVVLSCFMANFQLNQAMRSFSDLEEAARTYDAVFDSWTRATDLLPISVHRVRYERMVDDLEGEMKQLLGYFELPWDAGVLDNRASAAKREHIRTASYSQVTEPLYKRAAGRWERYRTQMEPVLPILAPWIHKLGYSV